jgi:hypothetical protein
MATEVKDVVSRILGGIGSTFDDELTLSGDEARSIASLLESLSSQVVYQEEGTTAADAFIEAALEAARADAAESRATAAEGRVALLEEALSEGLDLCVRARKMDAMEKDRAEMYLRNPKMTRSLTIPLWVEEHYQSDLSAWEAKARARLAKGGQ